MDFMVCPEDTPETLLGCAVAGLVAGRPGGAVAPGLGLVPPLMGILGRQLGLG